MTFQDLPKVDGLVLGDLTDEQYREYDYGNRIYRITNPIGVYFRLGGNTHRVIDADGVAHCVTFPGENKSVVLRWLSSHPCSW